MEAKGRVLVVDDEPGIRIGCQRALSSQGYQVDAAANGTEGLQKLRNALPEPDHPEAQVGGYDLVLLDIMMPGMSGMETLKHILAIDPNLVCIVITGYATVELAVQAIKQGAYDFVTKPFDADTLLLAVDQGIEKRQLSLKAQRLAELEARTRELARQKRDLERLDRIKSQFTLTVAHELRAPVAAIQSYLRLILDGYIPPEKQRQYLERAEQRALAQLELVTDLLDLAHLQDPDRPVEMQAVQLADVLEQVLDTMAAQAEEKQIDLRSTVAADLPTLTMNAQHARQLWTNLLSNAVKYTPQGGKVSVSLGRDGEHLVGSVEDTGIGITQDELALIFTEFYRTEASKAYTQMGTGLGLTIVKRVLETYGGEISVESEPDRGSSFTFRIPIAQALPSGPQTE
jgi:signal transduction histidine kinase